MLLRQRCCSDTVAQVKRLICSDLDGDVLGGMLPERRDVEADTWREAGLVATLMVGL
jgi:hypothetical protein